jgi:pyruvate/2-oxoglutarate dehydrogenase complex dihydrolipoamide dehydrogenase (E3) component
MQRSNLKIAEIETDSNPEPGYGEVFPTDSHNAKLVGNVHPRDWSNPQPAPRYNLVVIGGGTAGLVTAAGAAGLGAKVALVERHLLGGDCLNVGCVPSKCLIRSSRVFGELRDAARLGFRVPAGAAADFPAVMERMRRLRAHISRHDSAHRYQNELGVDVFIGSARFSGPDTVEVGDQTLRFKRAVIASGARAAHPAIEGMAEAGFLTNETVFSLTELPRRLAVIGGGPIGCELAQAFRRLGSEVVLFHNSDHILDREDADAAEIVQQTFQREGIRLVLDAAVRRIVRKGNEKRVLFEAGSSLGEIDVDQILVGAGRIPNVEGLDLEAVGVRYGKHGVVVNDRLQTTNPRIYAAGDICMSYKFTHAADFAARIVIQNALFLGRKKLSTFTMPWCTYTDPEIAHVGLYERDATARGIAIDTFVQPLSGVDRAVADGDEEGFVKVHVKKGTDRILGATIVARHAGEMISEITVAMAGKLGLGAVAGVIHPYPTQAEGIRKVADQYNRTRLTPFVKSLFTRWLAWNR